MRTRYFSLIIGILFLAIGILGFVPGLVTAPPAGVPDIAVDAGYGYLFGLFPVNVLHNIVHLVVGVLGIYCYRNALQARAFSKGLAWFYGILAVMGLFPVLNTTFKLIPLFGNDIWLHALTAAVAAYFGYARATDPLLEAQRGATGTTTTASTRPMSSPRP